MANGFVWYELMTSDPDAAERFYGSVLGWDAERWSESPRYTIAKAGEARVAGIMPVPEEAEAAGGRPMWFGYVGVADVDAATEALKAAGGAVHRPPSDIPEVGRFAVVADPGGAVFMMFRPHSMPPDQPKEAGTSPRPGTIGWRELHAADGAAAFDFYAGQFGWTKERAVDMGPMGTYQVFAADGVAVGGMMTKFAATPHPMWQYYWHVDGVEAALTRVRDGGGQVLFGPTEVPGGDWVANCLDPQGAAFSVVGSTR